MDIQSEKYSLIEYITQITDVKKFERLLEFVKANDEDFWNDLTNEQQQEIQQGIDELERGEKFDYEELMTNHR